MPEEDSNLAFTSVARITGWQRPPAEDPNLAFTSDARIKRGQRKTQTWRLPVLPELQDVSGRPKLCEMYQVNGIYGVRPVRTRYNFIYSITVAAMGMTD